MSTRATKLAKAFYHDEITDDKLEYFASGGKGQGTQCRNSDFDLDIQKYIRGHPGYWVLAIQINKRTSRKTLESVKRKGKNGNKISGNATPVVAQVLVPDPIGDIKAQHVRAALDASMEGATAGLVHNVKMTVDGTYAVEHHSRHDAAHRQGSHIGASRGKRIGKVAKSSNK